MSFFRDWLLSFVQKVDVQPLPLRFEMDQDEDGRQIVSVFRKFHTGEIQVGDINTLLGYGYREEERGADGNVVYRVLHDQDRQTLLSMRSLNPEVKEDGTLVFDVAPPVLQYLRKKPNIFEGERSSKLHIREQPVTPVMKIEYNPHGGLRASPGFAVEDGGEIVPPERLRITPDGGYIRAGDTFIPKTKVSEKAQQILVNGPIYVALPKIPEFFLRDLVLIKNDFNAVLTDLASQIRIINTPIEPVVQVNQTTPGWLDFKVEYQSAGFKLPESLLPKITEKSHLRIDPTTWVTVDPEIIKKTNEELSELGAERTTEGYRVPASQFASLEEFITNIGGRAELSKSYREFLDQLTGFKADEKYNLPDEVEQRLSGQGIRLRPYQRAGVQWLNWMRSNHLHGILADDMGLGKTIQSLIVLRLAYDETKSSQHSLIVAPKSVLHHWERELKRCFPFIRVALYHGTNRRTSFLRSSLPYVVITTYDTVWRDIDDLSKVPFFYLILDEATKIKNPTTVRTQSIKALNAAHRLALSGTPVENRPAELWSVFDFLMRGHLGSYGTFARVYEQSILSGDGRASEHLGRRVHPFLLRRKKEDVAKDLPEKLVMKEYCELTFEQKQLYGGLQDEMSRIVGALRRGDYINIAQSVLPVLTKLKQICDHPALVTQNWTPIYGRSEKFDRIMEKIDEIVSEGEQVVVFSHFLGMLDLFQMALQEKRYPYIRIDGSTQNRQAPIDVFNRGGAKVALLSLMAAGHGINMTSANHVIHADRWWNPAVEDQATDRVHRIGQDRTVYVYHLLTEGTLEERIETLMERKRSMADQILGAATRSDLSWTREELIELLRPLG